MKQPNIIGNRKEYVLKNLKYSYDKLNDLFYAYKENSSIFSNVIIGEFHLEIDKEGSIVGIEILGASGLLEEYGITKELLEDMQDVIMKIVSRNNSLIVFLIIKTQKIEKSATITMNNLNSPIIKAIEET